MAPDVRVEQDLLSLGILGPLSASWAGGSIPLGGRQQRAVLAFLATRDGVAVPVASVAEAIWGERVPPGYAATVQTYVSHLRDLLEPGRDRGAPSRYLRTDAGGYRFLLDGGRLDAAEFERLVAAGQAATRRGAYPQAKADLDAALALWRGTVLADLADYGFVAPIAARLDQLRWAAIETLIDARLALGEHQTVVGDLEKLIDANPLREALHGQRMLALYRCGLQADALAGYHRLRATLDAELGIEPGPALQRLHQSILAQDGTLDWHPASVDTGPPERPAPDDDQTGRTRTGRAARRRTRLVWSAVVAVLLLATTVTVAVVWNATRSSLSALPANSVGSIHADGTLHAAVPVGQSPGAIAFGAGSLWVTNATDGTVSRVDPRSHTVVQTIEVGRLPEAIAVTGQDVWVALFGDGEVRRINTEAQKVVQTIDVGSLPAALAADAGGVWVANSGDDTIQRIDPVTGVTGQPIDVGGDPDGIALDGHTVWVANGRDGTVSRIDPATGAEIGGPIVVGSEPTGIAFTSDSIWVANAASLSVTRIDAATLQVVDTLPVGDGPGSIVADGRGVWVADQYDGTITRIDPARGHAVQKYGIGASPTGLAVAGSTVWVTSRALAGSAHVGGTLTIAAASLPGNFTGIDPAYSYNLATFTANRLVYDGLVAFRPTSGAAAQTLVPDLATEIPQPTGGDTTYTFTLRRGIHYSDGVEVHAADFVLGVKRALLATNGGNPWRRVRICSRKSVARTSSMKCRLRVRALPPIKNGAVRRRDELRPLGPARRSAPRDDARPGDRAVGLRGMRVPGPTPWPIRSPLPVGWHPSRTDRRLRIAHCMPA